jgi:acyclic terpene utilization AtuA family protein
MDNLVRIGCGAGFAGDRADASAAVIAELAHCSGPRFLMFETLAERTLALCQIERRRDPTRGFSPAVERMLPAALGPCLSQGIRVVGNFGGANPHAAGRRIAELARDAGFPQARIAVIEGDDLTDTMPLDELRVREVGGTLLADRPVMVAANVYLGAEPIAQALDAGADIVITGRVADPALVLGPLAHAFGWDWSDWQRLATGTLAGHLLECGAQVTGGYFADPGVKDVPDLANVGYPIAEVAADGTFVVTKPRGTGGLVDRRTVTEQILYEVHDPAAYLTPDVILDITNVELADAGRDRIRVAGARGSRRPQTLKATVFVESGMLGEAEISYAGPNASARARLAADIVTTRMRRRAPDLRLRIDAIGCDSTFGTLAQVPPAPPAPASPATAAPATAAPMPPEIRLRFAAQSLRREPVELLLDEVEALYCAGPAGGCGVRRHLSPRLASASCLIERERVTPRVTFVGDMA